MLKKNKKEERRGISLSIRLFDENFDVIFGLTKQNYRKGLKELDDLFKAKFGEGINEILRDRKGAKTGAKSGDRTSRDR